MKELSEFLKVERSKRDLTVESFSRRSGISIDMLLALEAGEGERFGASLLIRNTIRAYCKALRIDPEPLIEQYASEIEKYNIQDAGIKRFGREMKLLHKKRRMLGFPLLMLTLATAAVIYGGAWISEKRSKLYAPPAADRFFTQEDLPVELQEKLAPTLKADRREPREGQVAGHPGTIARSEQPVVSTREADKAIRLAEKNINEAESVKAARSEQDQPAPSAGAPAPLALSNSTEAVAEDKPASLPGPSLKCKFAVEADDKVWIQVRIDDKQTRSTMLYPGDRREWTADKTMQIVVGNAGGIRMKWNDQAIKAPRDAGRVLRMRLPEYAKESE